KDPAQRYASAAELRGALEGELQRLENPSARAVSSPVETLHQIGFDDTAAFDSGEQQQPALDEQPNEPREPVGLTGDVADGAAASGGRAEGQQRLVLVAIVLVSLCVLVAGG